jgi:hypothetical protein
VSTAATGAQECSSGCGALPIILPAYGYWGWALVALAGAAANIARAPKTVPRSLSANPGVSTAQGSVRF